MYIHKKSLFHKIKLFFFNFLLLYSHCPSYQDVKKKKKKKTSSVDFTVVTDSDIPKELKKLIKERRKNPFELSFSDGSYLYVVKGYGKQQATDYSIIVNDFYMSEDTLVFDTDLSGPEKESNTSQKPSYPYIVIKTRYIENSIVFK